MSNITITIEKEEEPISIDCKGMVVFVRKEDGNFSAILDGVSDAEVCYVENILKGIIDKKMRAVLDTFSE